MTIRRKREKRILDSNRAVFLDRPLEFLALFSAVAAGSGTDGREGDGSKKRNRALQWLGLIVVILLASGVIGWKIQAGEVAETAQADRASEAETGGPRAVPLPAGELLDRAAADGWADRMSGGAHHEALRALERLAETEPMSGSARRALGILRWITALDADETARDGEAALSIWSDDARIREQLAFWEENRTEVRELMKDLAVRDLPEALAGRVYHRIDRLQTRGYRCLEDIRRLKREVDESVAAGQPERLFPVLAEFRKRHPDLAGVDALRDDLEMLAEVCRCAREGRVERIRAIRDTHVFVSDRIAREVERMASRERPPAIEDGPAISLGTRPNAAAGGPVESRVRLTGLEIRKPCSREALSFRLGDSNPEAGRKP